MHKLKQTIFFLLRRIAYTIASLLVFIYPKQERIVVLCYHSISNGKWQYSVSPDVFIAQINSILETHRSISIAELYDYIKGKTTLKSPAFLLCFDDGYKDIMSTVDFLSSVNVKPVVFILSEPENSDKDQLDNNLQLLSDENVKSLLQKGWSLGSHSATHADFSRLDSEQLKVEIADSKSVLENKYNTKVHWFAYPRGRYTSAAIKYVIKTGYLLALSMDAGTVSPEVNHYTVPRVGIDATHSLSDFKLAYSWPIILFRKVFASAIKRLL